MNQMHLTFAYYSIHILFILSIMLLFISTVGSLCVLSYLCRLVTGGIPEGHFTHVFVDEAGHAVETECLIPLAGKKLRIIGLFSIIM